MGLFFPETEHHEDGSKTERWTDCQSLTTNSDGTVREHSRPEATIPVIGPWDTQVTYDGDGNVINVQDRD
jgi:hypothetical protein